MKKLVVHMGDAGVGALKCRAPIKDDPRNWTWKPEEVTCKKCLKILADLRQR